MKAPLATTLILLLSVSSLFAQIKRGNFLVGGNISITRDGNEGNTSTNKITSTAFHNNATGAFFVANGLCLGLGIPYDIQHTSYDPADSYTYDSKTSGIKPFLRYYIPVSSIFIVTEGMGILTATSSKVEQNFNGLEYKNKGSGANIGFGLGTGIAFRLNDHVLLELMGNYQYTKSNFKYDDSSDTTHSKYKKLFFNIGFNFLLPGK
jgi:hypothetical protein